MSNYDPYTDPEFAEDGGFNPLDPEHIVKANQKLQQSSDLNNANYELAEQVVDKYIMEHASLKDLYFFYLLCASVLGVNNLNRNNSAIVGLINTSARMRFDTNFFNEAELHAVTMKISGGEL